MSFVVQRVPARSLAWVVGLMVFVTACGSSAETPSTSAQIVAPSNVAPDPVDVPARSFQESSFAIRGEGGAATVGQPATYRVFIEARGGFHLNADYPTSLTLSAPASISLALANISKEQATSFAETSAVFPVTFTANAAGTSEIRVVVDFAVCTEQNCQPESRTLLLPVTAS